MMPSTLSVGNQYAANMAAEPGTDQAMGVAIPGRRVWHTPGRRAGAPTTGESPDAKRLGLQRRIAPTPPPAMQILDLPAATQIIQQMISQADLDLPLVWAGRRDVDPDGG